MRTALYLLATAALATLTLAATPKISEAQAVYPWCAHYGGRDMGGAPSCGFVTYAQCMASASGRLATCGLNPGVAFAQQTRGRINTRLALRSAFAPMELGALLAKFGTFAAARRRTLAGPYEAKQGAA